MSVPYWQPAPPMRPSHEQSSVVQPTPWPQVNMPISSSAGRQPSAEDQDRQIVAEFSTANPDMEPLERARQLEQAGHVGASKLIRDGWYSGQDAENSSTSKKLAKFQEIATHIGTVTKDLPLEQRGHAADRIWRDAGYDPAAIPGGSNNPDFWKMASGAAPLVQAVVDGGKEAQTAIEKYLRSDDATPQGVRQLATYYEQLHQIPAGELEHLTTWLKDVPPGPLSEKDQTKGRQLFRAITIPDANSLDQLQAQQVQGGQDTAPTLAAMTSRSAAQTSGQFEAYTGAGLPIPGSRASSAASAAGQYDAMNEFGIPLPGTATAGGPGNPLGPDQESQDLAHGLRRNPKLWLQINPEARAKALQVLARDPAFDLGELRGQSGVSQESVKAYFAMMPMVDADDPALQRLVSMMTPEDRAQVVGSDPNAVAAPAGAPAASSGAPAASEAMAPPPSSTDDQARVDLARAQHVPTDWDRQGVRANVSAALGAAGKARGNEQVDQIIEIIENDLALAGHSVTTAAVDEILSAATEPATPATPGSTRNPVRRTINKVRAAIRGTAAPTTTPETTSLSDLIRQARQ